MNKRILTAIALTLALVMALSGCTYFNAIFGSIFKGPQVELTDAPLNAEKLVDFTQEVDPSVLFASDGWSNGDVFNVVWKSHNVVFENGIMRLGITEEKVTTWLNEEEVEFNYTAGEARTQNYYHYGDYEVSMKPSANPGTASTFFVCTGPYDEKTVTDAEGNTTKVPNAHDEIDIEFLGKDTTKVQFNFFVDGQGGNEYMYDLGFDASKEFHKYGFRWTETSITWFVDGVPVYKVTTDKTATGGTNLRVVEKLPSTAGRMLTNYWCGNERAWGWMGEYKGAVNDNGTEYQWIATSAEGAPLNPPVQNPDNGENGDPVTPPAGTDDLQFEYWISNPDLYVVEGNNIKYNGLGNSYACIGTDISTIAAGKDTFTVTVTNNGEADARVRFDIQATNKIGNHDACNVSAVGGDVWTDAEWGGSMFTVAAGQTVTVAITYNENSERGAVKNLVIFVDAFRGDSATYTTDVTLSGMTFSKAGATEPSDPADPVDPPVDPVDPPVDPVDPPANPTSGDLSTTINGSEVTFEGNVTDGYAVNANDENNTVNVAYTNIVGDSYKNIWVPVSSIAGNRTAFTVKVTNNGTVAVKVRIDIESQTIIENNVCACNTSSTQDGNAGYTDLVWGGSMFEITAGATATLVVNYDASKQPTNLKIFVDSHTYQDTNVYSGNITLSEMAFTGEYVPESGNDPEPEPEPQPEYTYSDLYVEFKTENAYTLTSENQYTNTVNVTYSDIAQNSWNNINIWVADKSADCTRFSMKLTNNGAAQVSVWVQMKDEAGAELINQNVNIAAGATEVFTFDYTGTAQMIFFFVDSTHEAAAGPNAGNITISEIKLGKVAATEEPTPTPEVIIPEGQYLSYTANDIYTLSATPEQYVNSLTVAYTNAETDTYLNVNTWIEDKAANKSTLSVYIKNTGAAEAKITVKLEKNGTSHGESTVTIAAGETLHVELAYTEGPSMLYFFIGTGWNNDAHTQSSGEVVISGVEFK